MTEAEQIEQYIKEKGVTRCPDGHGFGTPDFGRIKRKLPAGGNWRRGKFLRMLAKLRG